MLRRDVFYFRRALSAELRAPAPLKEKRAGVGRRALVAVPVLASALYAGCASAPPPPPAPVITFEMKMSWILRLEDQRVLRDPEPPPAPVIQPVRRGRQAAPPPPPPTPDLIWLLTDGEARIRRRAALAVGRVGLAEGVAPLVPLLTDPDPEVRQMAAFSLGLIGDRSAIEPLRTALGDASPLVQGRAAESLGLMGDTASASAIAGMVAVHVRGGTIATLAPDDLRYPLDPAIEAFRLGIYALARLKAYEGLGGALLGPDAQPLVRWWPVAYALQRVEDRRLAPALLTLARTDTIYTRAFAIRGLGLLRERAAAPILLPALDLIATNSASAVEAIRALGRIGDPKATAPLLKIAATPAIDPMVRAEAIVALGAIRRSEGVHDLLLELLADPSPTVRSVTYGALASLDRESFITVLSGLDPDPNWTVRAALANTLGGLEPAVGVGRLQQMLSDADLRAVPAILSALTKLQAPGVEKILFDRLQNEDPVVRASAATNLGELRPAGGADALVAAYRQAQRDPMYVARAAALAALAKYGLGPAGETLRAALGDKDWAVRIRAVELLKELDPNVGDLAMAIRPAPTSRSAAEYQAAALVNPTVSPHMFIETGKGTIEIELAVLDAPLTTNSFVGLILRGFFDGLGFHRVVPNFVIQDGDPRGDGEGGPGFTIRDELNQRPYLRGTVGMALDWRDTGGSQFFITHSPQPHLDARYTVFGTVVNGQEVVDRLTQGDMIKRVRVWNGSEMLPR